MSEPFEDLNPAPRLLMGSGPINADLRVLRAMTRRSGGQSDGPAPETSRSTSRSTDNPR